MNIFYNLFFFWYDLFLGHNKIKFSTLDIVESWSNEMWSVLHVTCVDIIAQLLLPRWFVFSYLDVSALKLRIIIIVLLSDRPEIILLTARTTKNQIAFD